MDIMVITGIMRVTTDIMRVTTDIMRNITDIMRNTMDKDTLGKNITNIRILVTYKIFV
jgi:hypothetical protein